jgi:hypothetical protein
MKTIENNEYMKIILDSKQPEFEFIEINKIDENNIFITIKSAKLRVEYQDWKNDKNFSRKTTYGIKATIAEGDEK